MRIHLILFLAIFQLGYATEEDSLQRKNPFLKYHFIMDDDDCDACGCSASGGSMGFASMLNTNFVGIRYFNQEYKSSDGLYSNSAWYDEHFNTAQVWARIPILKKVQLSVLLPYHFHSRETKTGKEDINGFGDATVLAMYRLYQTHKDSTVLVHTWLLGGGVKVPTGKFNETNSGSINPSFQVGTGSWDYLLATEYTLKRKQFGFNTLLNYVIKTENRKQYRFGNQFNYAGTFFFLYENNGFSLAPQIGFAGEVYESNYQRGHRLRDTSGDIVFSKLGVELGRKKFSCGVNTMLPIHQNLANGNVVAQYRWAVNLNYSL